MFVVGVSNRGITSLVPRGVIGLLRLLVLLLCLSTFGVCVFVEPFPRIGFGRSAPSLGALWMFGKETP